MIFKLFKLKTSVNPSVCYLFSVLFCTQGGKGGRDTEASMTAFVLIAMQEARHICLAKVNVSQPSQHVQNHWGSGPLVLFVSS